MSRDSKDIARRLRFDHRPSADFFRRWYLVVGGAAALIGGGLWFGFTTWQGSRQYLPGPITPAHATFGGRCEQCHDPFSSTPDARCRQCHAPAPHGASVATAPPCRACHMEHRGAALLVAGTDQPCIDCHAELHSRDGMVAQHIVDFAGHPEPRAIRAPAGDPTHLRFNHALHLTSKNVTEPLTCAHCHAVDADGERMVPIEFESHCRRCHALKVTEEPAPIGALEAPHASPADVRDGLRQALILLAVAQPQALFEGDAARALIPGQAAPAPVDASRSLQEFQSKWVKKLEDGLYRPFNPATPLAQNNKYCFLCHEESAERTGDLPAVVDTKLPARWLAAAEFSHRRHAKMACADCHTAVRDSAATADVNLPKLDVCKRCHGDGRAQSAGTSCTLCHVYHRQPHADVGPEMPTPTPVPTVGLERLLGH